MQVYHLVDGRYQEMPANERGHYQIPLLGVELGIWPGRYQNVALPWLRWWDGEGHLLLTGEERAERERQQRELAQQQAELERQRADQERQEKELAQQRAEQAQQRAERLAAQLRALGIDPDV